jgi:hypothetical protein
MAKPMVAAANANLLETMLNENSTQLLAREARELSHSFLARLTKQTFAEIVPMVTQRGDDGLIQALEQFSF